MGEAVRGISCHASSQPRGGAVGQVCVVETEGETLLGVVESAPVV